MVDNDDEEEDEEGIDVGRGGSASWNLTFIKSRGCITRVATVPAPNPATAWSCDTTSVRASRS